MNPGLVVKLRPNGPWRIGPDSGARNRVDVIYHSDSLYSAVTAAMSRLGWLEEWLDATARTGASAVSFGSCYPYMDDINFVVPPRTVWPPSPNSAKAPRVRWRSARFVPLKVVQSILSGKRVDENQWSVDGPSDCLVPNGKPGPFRTAVRFSAGIDRLTGTAERHSTGCIEFRPGSGLWTVVSFRDQAAHAEWSDKVKAAFRLLADSGFGGERSRGWGRSDAPVFVEGMLPDLILPIERIKAAAVRERRQAAQLKVTSGAETPLAAAVDEAPAVSESEPTPAEAPAVEEAPIETASEPAQAETSVVEEPAGEAARETPEAESSTAEPVAQDAAAPIEDTTASSEAYPAPPAGELAAEVPGFTHEEENPVEPASKPLMTEGAAETNEAAPASELPSEEVAPVQADAAPTDEAPLPGDDASEPVPEAVTTEGAEGKESAIVTESPAEETAPVPAEAASSSEAPLPDDGGSEPVTEGPSAAITPEPASATHHPHWLLSVFTPAPSDTVDWARGNYTVLARGGRIDSPVRSGELKKQIQMVAEGSVLYAESAPSGSAADVAPDGFAHPVFRAGFAVAIPLPEVS